LLNSNIFPTRPYNMLNFGLLPTEMVSLVWGTPANFNGFRVLASLLQRRRSPEANQTLHDVWPSPGLLHYIYIFWGSCPLTEFRHVQNSLYVQVAFSYIGSVTARHSSSRRQPNCGVVQAMELANFRRRRHLYSAGRPSRWASAHILVSHVSDETQVVKGPNSCHTTPILNNFTLECGPMPILMTSQPNVGGALCKSYY